MKRLLVMLVSAIVSVVVASIVQAAPTESTGDTGSSDLTREPRTAWAAALEGKNSVTPKFGSYALSAQRQDLKMYGDEGCILFCIFGTGFAVHSFPIEMQSSSAVAGLEYERRTPWGYSLGAELLHNVHGPKIPLRSNDSAPRTGQIFGDLDLSGRGLFIGASVHF